MNTSKKKNYTIIRPSITYGTERLQLGVWEKENWLHRALHQRSIVFSEDIAFKYTTMTSSYDVAKGILYLIGNLDALGETYHITSEKAYTWNEILNVYLTVFKEELGFTPNVVMTHKSTKIRDQASKYQVIYCRYYDRRFSNAKIKKYVNVDDFIDPLQGTVEALRMFLKSPDFKPLNGMYEALNDIAAHELTPLSEFKALKQKIMYICYKLHIGILIDFYKHLRSYRAKRLASKRC